MDAHLASCEWLELGHPSIADIACFPYTAMAREGDIDITPYANIQKWIEQFKRMGRIYSHARHSNDSVRRELRTAEATEARKSIPLERKLAMPGRLVYGRVSTRKR